jgi:hypothetical protein
MACEADLEQPLTKGGSGSRVRIGRNGRRHGLQPANLGHSMGRNAFQKADVPIMFDEPSGK